MRRYCPGPDDGRQQSTLLILGVSAMRTEGDSTMGRSTSAWRDTSLPPREQARGWSRRSRCAAPRPPRRAFSDSPVCRAGLGISRPSEARRALGDARPDDAPPAPYSAASVTAADVSARSRSPPATTRPAEASRGSGSLRLDRRERAADRFVPHAATAARPRRSRDQATPWSAAPRAYASTAAPPPTARVSSAERHVGWSTIRAFGAPTMRNAMPVRIALHANGAATLLGMTRL